MGKWQITVTITKPNHITLCVQPWFGCGCSEFKNIYILSCQSRDVDSQFCSCDASLFTVNHFRPCLPSVCIPHGYLFVDLKQSTPEHLCSNILPNSGTYQYAYIPKI